eukprot:2143238-Prymnesium_polylepis.1
MHPSEPREGPRRCWHGLARPACARSHPSARSMLIRCLMPREACLPPCARTTSRTMRMPLVLSSLPRSQQPRHDRGRGALCEEAACCPIERQIIQRGARSPARSPARPLRSVARARSLSPCCLPALTSCALAWVAAARRHLHRDGVVAHAGRCRSSRPAARHRHALAHLPTTRPFCACSSTRSGGQDGHIPSK